MTAMFVNLPVTDLERAKAFYTALGFTINPVFSDHNAACVVVEEDHSYFMILMREYFQTFTDLPIGDPAVNPTVATAIFLDSREAVDRAVGDGLAAGGSEAHPATDYGFMYQRQLTDPDGNILEFGYMDPAAAEQGPEAFVDPAGLRSMAARDYGQYCGVTRALELVGERWAMLIVRDLLVGPRRYGELAAGLPRIPSNILAARLKELQEAGVLRRVPHSRVIVYELTPYGRELEPVVMALGAWGFKAMGDPREEQIITPDSMTMSLRTAFRPQVAASLPATAYAARLGPAELLIRVDGSTLDVMRGDGVGRPRLLGRSGHPPDHLRRARPGSCDRHGGGRGAARSWRSPRPLRQHLPPGGLSRSLHVRRRLGTQPVPPRTLRDHRSAGPTGGRVRVGSTERRARSTMVGWGDVPERTADGRYMIIRGRRWRATDPAIPADVSAKLRAELMSARRAVGIALRSG